MAVTQNTASEYLRQEIVMSTAAETVVRELDRRFNDGFDVRLLGTATRSSSGLTPPMRSKRSITRLHTPATSTTCGRSRWSGPSPASSYRACGAAVGAAAPPTVCASGRGGDRRGVRGRAVALEPALSRRAGSRRSGDSKATAAARGRCHRRLHRRSLSRTARGTDPGVLAPSARTSPRERARGTPPRGR
jgi:hypothetical protein